MKLYKRKEIIENATLYQGDCLEVMKIIPDKSIDMILCDLPYGTTACKWDVIIPFEPLWEQYKRIIKDKGAIVLFGSEPFSTQIRSTNIKEFKYDWIWEKERGIGFQIAKYRPLQKHEIISVFGKGTINYFPIMKIGKYKINKCGIYKSKDSGKVSPLAHIYKNYKGNYDNKYYPLSILYFKRDKNRLHPTQKPVALLQYLIKTYTLENEIILDNCMGSGSTGIAAKYLNRKFIGIELDKKYFNIAVNRIKNPKQFIKETDISNSLFKE